MSTIPRLPRPSADEPPRRRWRRWIGALALLLLMGGLVWAMRPDPHMSRVKELQKELAENKELSPEDRKARFTELRTEMKQLSDDQKWELAAPMRAKQKAEMDRYFALSDKERIKYLDEKIDKSEKMRKEWEKKAGAAGGGKGGNGPVGFNGGGGGPAGGRGPGGAVGPGGGSGSGGNGGSPKQRSSEDIEKRRREMLDRSSPEERAERDRYRKEMNDRRKQRGLAVR